MPVQLIANYSVQNGLLKRRGQCRNKGPPHLLSLSANLPQRPPHPQATRPRRKSPIVTSKPSRYPQRCIGPSCNGAVRHLTTTTLGTFQPRIWTSLPVNPPTIILLGLPVVMIQGRNKALHSGPSAGRPEGIFGFIYPPPCPSFALPLPSEGWHGPASSFREGNVSGEPSQAPLQSCRETQ